MMAAMCKAALAVPLVLLAASALAAPAFKSIPAGMYRIDADNEIIMGQGKSTIRVHEDGATGTTTDRTRAGDSEYAHTYKGKGPVTRCVQPTPAGGTSAWPFFDVPCKAQSTKTTANGFVHVAQCNGQRTTVTVQRLDDDKWIVDQDIEALPGAKAPDMTGMRPMLERTVQTGTPDQRAKAEAMLKQLPQMQGQLDQQRTATIAGLMKSKAEARTAEEAAAFDGAIKSMQQSWNGDLMKVKRREHWTRISLNCASGKS